MRKRPFAALLTCAVVLLAFAPTRALAQTAARVSARDAPAQTAAARTEQKPALRSVFAEEMAKSERAGNLSAADVKRLEKESLDPRPQGGGSNWSKKKVVLVVAVIVVIVGLAIVLAHNGVNPVTTCDEDPTDPNCVP